MAWPVALSSLDMYTDYLICFFSKMSIKFLLILFNFFLFDYLPLQVRWVIYYHLHQYITSQVFESLPWFRTATLGDSTMDCFPEGMTESVCLSLCMYHFYFLGKLRLCEAIFLNVFVWIWWLELTVWNQGCCCSFPPNCWYSCLKGHINIGYILLKSHDDFVLLVVC